MLIYINQLTIEGDDPSKVAFRSIAGWLKNITKKHFSISMLKKSANYPLQEMKVRTYSATENTPHMYSILLSHPDKNVRGRQWITEIGIKEEDTSTTVSILLQTSDISTRVTDIPSTTRPRLIDYLQKNATLNPETIGLKPRIFSNEIADFERLKQLVMSPDRDYPLVFISKKKLDHKPLVNPEDLQKQLIGLAQVIYSDDPINSWDLENILTRQYCAWDGAINIIYPSRGRDYCHHKLFTQVELTELELLGKHLQRELLSFVTHTTNAQKKKKHFSPTDVRAKRQRDLRIRLKTQFEGLTDQTEYQKLAEEAFDLLADQDATLEQLKADHEKEMDEQQIKLTELHGNVSKLTYENENLKSRINKVTKEPLLVRGKEQEHYSNEICDLILSELSRIDRKANTRQDHIIADVLNHNKNSKSRDNLIMALKNIFSNYNGITSKMKKELKKYGLEVIENGNHNHLRFIGDSRYQVVFAKTPSDKSRIGNNIIRDIKSQLL